MDRLSAIKDCVLRYLHWYGHMTKAEIEYLGRNGYRVNVIELASVSGGGLWTVDVTWN